MLKYIITMSIIILIVLLAYVLSIKYPWLGEFEEEDEDMLEIKIKYLRDIKPLEILSDGDWIDLRAAVDVVLEPGGYCCLPLGVAMELPKGYSAIIAPRSSTYAKWGIIQTNSIGVIDNSYCGDTDEWMLPILAFRKTTIHKNDRVCQFRLIPQDDPIELIKVSTLGNKDRGGFGSTGHE